MKLKGILSLALVAVICGCSCGRVNETTYKNAVINFNTTDAISFERIEKTTDKNDSSSYTKTVVEGMFIFDTNRNGEVVESKYVIKDYVVADNRSTLEYYYSSISNTLYRKKIIAGLSEDRVKESMEYEDYFNIHNCSTSSCRAAISTNIAPIINIEDVNGFVIEKEEDEAVATYTAACPTYENCQGNEKIDYKLIIGGDGNIVGLYYTIPGPTTTTTISYHFKNFGSDKVIISFPTELESYIDGNID